MNCLICGTKLTTSVCQGKTGRKALMLVCPKDGRHFRAFINDIQFIEQVSEPDILLEKALIHSKEDRS
jgi:hypothetical protein